MWAVRAIRGAITVESNTPEAIEKATFELLNGILKENKITNNDIISAIFTLTHDLNAEFPAKTARIQLGWDDIPMICTQEIPVPHGIQMCLRTMLTVNTTLEKEELKHIYLGDAKNLRPDLAGN